MIIQFYIALHQIELKRAIIELIELVKIFSKILITDYQIDAVIFDGRPLIAQG